MKINKDIIKVLTRLRTEGFLESEEEVIGYYGFLKHNLSNKEIKDYINKGYHINDVDDWVMLRWIFGDMPFRTASKIANLLYNEDIEIMESKVKEVPEYNYYDTYDEAEYVWENYFKDIA